MDKQIGPWHTWWVEGGYMKPISIEQWQWLWNQRANTSRTEVGNRHVNDWLFELITEAGFDVVNNVVVRP
jgi:hypothetical protein